MVPITNSILAFSLLGIGIVAVVLILSLPGRKEATHQGCFRWAHRISGYVFFVLYVFIAVTMFQKLTSESIFLPAKDAIHAYLGVAIFPLVIIKICIARFYKKYYHRLPVYGVIIIITVFMTVTLSAGYYMLSIAGSQYIVLSHKGVPVKININIGRKVVQQKCSGCHSLERVYANVKTESDWRSYISRMRAKDLAVMNDAEELQVLGYLIKNMGIDDTMMDIRVGMRIILAKCHTCHTLERVFTSRKTQAEWVKTIEIMRSFDPNLLNDSEASQVNYYLGKVLARQEVVPNELK